MESPLHTEVVILLPATSSFGRFTKRTRGRLELTPREECHSVSWLPIATLVLAQKPFALALGIGEPGRTSYGTGQDLASSLRRDTSVERDTKRKLWQSLDPAELVMVLMKVQVAVVSNDQLRTEDARQKVGIAGDAGAVRQLVITPDFDERLAEKITRAVLVQFPAASPLPAANPVEELSANWNFTVCVGFDEAALDQDRIANVAAACRCAETRPLTRLISGHASSASQEIQMIVHPCLGHQSPRRFGAFLASQMRSPWSLLADIDPQ
jgi:hypothetical protein